MPTPIPQPWPGLTVDEAITSYIPELQQAVKECNADKSAIEQLRGSDDRADLD